MSSNLINSEKMQKKKTIYEKNELKKEIVEESIKIKKNQSENQFGKEISNLINHKNVMKAFSLALGDVPTSIEESFFSPEMKYFYLRANQWKYQIPLEFFKTLFLYFVREEIKTNSIPESNINLYLIEKHHQLISICSKFASPEFKQMEPTMIADDVVLRAYLKEDPMVSNILPIKIHKKIQSIKDLEMIIPQETKLFKKDDFNTLFQKNLEKLKEEFGEKVIDLELVEKLRNRTKELQNKIISLFQD